MIFRDSGERELYLSIRKQVLEEYAYEKKVRTLEADLTWGKTITIAAKNRIKLLRKEEDDAKIDIRDLICSL